MFNKRIWPLIICLAAFGQTPSLDPKNCLEDLEQNISKEITLEMMQTKIKESRLCHIQWLEKEMAMCSGNFSSKVISGTTDYQPSAEPKSIILTEREQEQCLMTLKRLNQNFLDAVIKLSDRAQAESAKQSASPE